MWGVVKLEDGYIQRLEFHTHTSPEQTPFLICEDTVLVSDRLILHHPGMPQVPFGTRESTNSKERIHAVKDQGPETE